MLGDILGLDRWDDYEEQAKARLRAAADEANLIDLRLAEIEQELARRPDHEAQAASAEQVVSDRSSAVEQARAAYRQVEEARTEMRSLDTQAAEISRRLSQTDQELTALAKDEEARSKRLAERQELVKAAEEIETGYTAYQKAVEREQELGAKLSRWTELQRRRTELGSQVEQARVRLQSERDSAARRVAEFRGRQADDVLLSEHETTAAKLAQLETSAQEQESDRSALASAGEQRAQLLARNEALHAEMDALKERMESLEKAGAECPLCSQPLTEEHRVEVLEQLHGEGAPQRRALAPARPDPVDGARRVDERQQQKGPLEDPPALEDQGVAQARVALLVEVARGGQGGGEAVELPPEQAEGVSTIVPPPVTQQAVAHYCASEWAVHLDDVMTRRSGWRYYRREHLEIARQVAHWMAEVLGWDDQTRCAELDAYHRSTETHFS